MYHPEKNNLHVSIFELILFYQFFTSLQCDLLTYRNLTMTPFLEEAGIEGSVDAVWGQEVNCLIDLGSVEFRLGQSAIHTLNMALQAWGQVGEQFFPK